MDAARSAARNAYAPYSKFSVGAAVLAKSGKTYLGANVENVSFPVGTCAEAAALAAARTAEGTQLVVETIAIYAEKKDVGHVPCAPCGACRQRILEFGANIRVKFFADGMTLEEQSAQELLPFSFKF